MKILYLPKKEIQIHPDLLDHYLKIIKPRGFILYCIYKLHYNPNSYISIRRISNKYRLSTKTIVKYNKILVHNKLLNITKYKNHNVYQPLEPQGGTL